MKRILVHSPVRQDALVLKAFLESLARLDTTGIAVDFAFHDDNADPLSSKLLAEFAETRNVRIAPPPNVGAPSSGHLWTDASIWRVAEAKDEAIQIALLAGFDHLFLVDSDLLLPRDTLLRLAAENDAGRPIVSNIFWTKWPSDPETPMPNVWASGVYDCPPDFIAKVREPGVHAVGGLGACTMIARSALYIGASFAPVAGLDAWGEDRHFCARARSLGLTLHVDSRADALHLYRPEDIARVPAFFAGGA